MIIELLNRDKHIIQIKSIDEMPSDLYDICSIQIIDYNQEDIKKSLKSSLI